MFCKCLLLAALTLALSARASAQPITYNLEDYPIYQNTSDGTAFVSGTITTDGTIGSLSASNITSVSFSVYNSTYSFSASSARAYGFLSSDHSLTATPTQLLTAEGSTAPDFNPHYVGLVGSGILRSAGGGTVTDAFQVDYSRNGPGRDSYRVLVNNGPLLAYADNPNLGGNPWVIGSATILPNSTANGQFHFLDLLETLGSLLFFDPPAAIGYDFSVDPNGPLFSQVKIPLTVAGHALTGPLVLSYDGTGYTMQPGETYTFPSALSQFSITGIPDTFAVDTTDDQAFVVGLAFNESGTTNMTMTPLTSVPEPGSLVLLGAAAGSWVLWRRRAARQSARAVAITAPTGP